MSSFGSHCTGSSLGLACWHILSSTGIRKMTIDLTTVDIGKSCGEINVFSTWLGLKKLGRLGARVYERI